MIKHQESTRLNRDNNRVRKTRKVFFLVGEFFLLVVVMVGIAAAARYVMNVLNSRNTLTNQATPPEGTCEGNPGTDVYYNGGQIKQCIGREYSVCHGLETESGGKACTNKAGTVKKSCVCHWVGKTTQPTSASISSPCSTNGGNCSPNQYCTYGRVAAGTNYCKSQNINWECCKNKPVPTTAKCQYKNCGDCLAKLQGLSMCVAAGCCSNNTTPAGSSGIPHAACNWTGTKCVPASTEPVPQPCFVDSGGQDCCGPISTCTGRNEAECLFARTCNSDGKTDARGRACLYNCGAPVDGGNPPGGEPPVGGGPGGGNDTTEAHRGEPCSGDSKAVCDGKKVGDVCAGAEICFNTKDETGTDGKYVCKCKTDGVPPGGEPPGGQPPAANPTSPPGTACSVNSEGVPCRNLKIGDICDAATQNKCVENTVNIVAAGPNCYCGLQTPTLPPGQQPSQPGTLCSPDSPNVCKSLKIGDVCDITVQQPKCADTFNNNVKLLDASLKPICQCGTGTTQPPPPAQTSPTSVPTLTPTPTIDLSKANWFAQGTGELCTSSTYRVFFTDRKCRDYSKIGFQTENLPNPSACNNDGIGECWKAMSRDGKKASRRPSAFKNPGSDACNSFINESNQDPPIFKHTEFPDSPVPCTFNIQPSSQITGNIKVEGEAKQFTRIAVYIKDTTDGTFYTENRDFNNTDKDPANDIRPNEDKPYNFDKLFANHTYEVYARAYSGRKGNKQVLNIEITAIPDSQTDTPCANGVCEVSPDVENATVDFIINFPPPTQSDIVKSNTNDKIESWLKDYEEGKCDARCFSKRIHDEIDQSLGLKTATCDPSLPGGCDFDPEDD